MWAAVFEKEDRAVAVGGVAGGGELMQPRAKQVVMNGQAGVLSLMAPLLYFWSAGLDVGRRCAADSVAGSVRRPRNAPRAPEFADDGAAG